MNNILIKYNGDKKKTFSSLSSFINWLYEDAYKEPNINIQSYSITLYKNKEKEPLHINEIKNGNIILFKNFDFFVYSFFLKLKTKTIDNTCK